MSSQEQTFDQVKSTWMQQAGQCLPTLQVPVDNTILKQGRKKREEHEKTLGKLKMIYYLPSYCIFILKLTPT